MSATSSRITRLVVAVGAALAFGTAPIATADPADLVPLCSGDESPGEDNCRTPCPEGAAVSAMGTCSEAGTAVVTGGPEDYVGSTSTGADPETPLGTDPNRVAYGGDI